MQSVALRLRSLWNELGSCTSRPCLLRSLLRSWSLRLNHRSLTTATSTSNKVCCINERLSICFLSICCFLLSKISLNLIRFLLWNKGFEVSETFTSWLIWLLLSLSIISKHGKQYWFRYLMSFYCLSLPFWSWLFSQYWLSLYFWFLASSLLHWTSLWRRRRKASIVWLEVHWILDCVESHVHLAPFRRSVCSCTFGMLPPISPTGFC